MVMLRIRNLEAGYGPLRVLKGVSLHVSAGEVVAIIGANGAGKTTLLKTIAGILRPQAGTIALDGADVGAVPAERIVQRGCALVPEGRHVFSNMTVRENLVLGGYACRRRNGGRTEDEAIVEICGLFPVLRERFGQLAGTLSGGQQQMLAIGRALMSRPRLLMMDEPSLGVAPLVVRDLYAAVTRLKQSGMTILLVEQNARAALAVADRGYVVETGQVVLEGQSWELADNPEVRRAYLGKEYTRVDEDNNNGSNGSLQPRN
jgi:branched-chain amino acid transport system ATP-binding protein